MEILVEIALGLGEFLLEILLPLLSELLVQLGVDWASQPPKPETKPRTLPAFIAAPLAFVAGLAAGWLSTFVVHSPHGQHLWRIAFNLLVVPAAVGVLMATIGAWRRRRGAPDGRLYHFVYGALFAFAMSLMRLHW